MLIFFRCCRKRSGTPLVESDKSSPKRKQCRPSSSSSQNSRGKTKDLSRNVLKVFEGLLESTADCDLDSVSDLIKNMEQMRERRLSCSGRSTASINNKTGSVDDSPPQLKKVRCSHPPLALVQKQ